MTVLVVEDQDLLRTTVHEQLSYAGYAVHEAADGATALEALRAGGVEVVLLDLGLPDIPGAEILEYITHSHPGLPVIVTSGEPLHAVEARFRGSLQKVGTLIKPFGLESLLDAVSAALAGPGEAS